MVKLMLFVFNVSLNSRHKSLTRTLSLKLWSSLFSFFLTKRGGLNIH